MSTFLPLRRAPGVRTVMLVAAVLLALPFTVVTATNLGAVGTNLERAEEIERGIERTSLWLELTAALSGESSVTAAVIGSDAIPDVIRGVWGLDFEDMLTGARADVDRRIDELGADDLRRELGVVRERVDRGELDLTGAVTALFEIGDEIRRGAQHEMTALLAATGSVQDAGEVTAAVEVARAAAAVSSRTSDTLSLWAAVATPLAAPDMELVRRFSDSLALRQAAIDELEGLLVPGTPAADGWAAVVDDPVFDQVTEIYSRTMSDLIAALMSDEPPVTEFDASMIPYFLDQVVLVQETIAALVDHSLGTYDFFETAVADVSASNTALQRDAAGARTRTFVLFGLFSALLLALVYMVVRLVVRPLVRMGEVVSGIADGDVDSRTEPSGLRELRTTATALNEAAASLERAQSMAVALAEERLDDPLFAEPTPGPLGAPLHAAVQRLAATMSQREEFRQRLEYEAAHDSLTLLPNRSAIFGHLASAMTRARWSGLSIGLLFIDVDGFKGVNDVHGHHAGDGLLEETARRLREVIRDDDQAGRLGGDEFVVVAETVSGLDEALLLADRILERLSEPFRIGSVMVTPSMSIGVAVTRGDDLSADELMREADLAVYRAKERGRGRVEVCDDVLRRETHERSELEEAIRRAIASDELVLHYQPIVEATTGRTVALEALVRWQRPEVGLVPPAGFIPMAERSDLIIEIDRWVSEAVVAQLDRWSGDPVFSMLPVSVNLSGRYLTSGSMSVDLISVLDRSGVDPARLVVEVTETAVLADLELAADELERVRAVGVRTALDDFGTGYMSLAVLRRLAVDVLKIDRSFVARIDRTTERSLVSLMIETGRLLGVDVVVEGIETTEQRDLVTALGAARLQGFLLGRPVPLAEIEPAISLPVG